MSGRNCQNTNPIEWNDHVDILKSIYDSNKTYHEMTMELNGICGTNYSRASVTHLCKRIFGDKKRVSDFKPKFGCLSAQEQKMIVDLTIQGIPYMHISNILVDKLGVPHHCAKTIKAFIESQGLKPVRSSLGRTTQFHIGHKLHRKGMHEIVLRKSNGYYYIKVKDDSGSVDNYIPYHRYIYQTQYGEIPDGWHVVFLDGDKTNFDVNNLYAVPMSVKAMMSKFDWWTDDRELTLAGILYCTLFQIYTKFNLNEL